MKVVIIGSGNVATVLGGRIAATDNRIVQVVARREAVAAALAAEWNCGYTTRWEQMDDTAELYIVSVSDRAIVQFGEQVSLPGRLVVHTAGAVPLAALADVSDRHGVLYPLQSLRKEIRPFPEFPLLIDAAPADDRETLNSFAHTIARQVQHADDDTRLKLHAAAVFVNNFTNYLYSLAADFCRQENIDFSLLLPLIRETAERLEHSAPRDLQTGPAIRGDRATLDRHLATLSNYRNMSELYKLFSDQIMEYHR
jgi:predicted short-subunit dehydrogenase-like oxidoreductase (DUF2520 family)